MIRLGFRLIGSKGAINKDLIFDKDFTVFRFTLGFGIIAAVYRIVRLIFRKLRSAKREEEVKAQGGSNFELFLSTAISGIGFAMMVPYDRKVYKVVLYSIAIKALVRLIGD